MANFVYHHWGYTSIYWPLSYPFRSLGVCLLSQSMDCLELPGWFLTPQEKSSPEKNYILNKKSWKKSFFCFLVFLHSSLSQRMAESQKWELKYRLVNTATLPDE